MTQPLANTRPSTTILSHSNMAPRGYAVVRVEFPASSKLICTMYEDTTITGINGAQTTFKKGEQFTLQRSESLGDNLFYVVPRIAPALCLSLSASIKARDEAAMRFLKRYATNVSSSRQR